MHEDNINILIVDDTPSHIQIAGEILKELGCPIRVANSGVLTLELIKKQIPTIILLDVQMPDESGFEICRKIKENHKYKDIAVIFITVDNDEKSIRDGFAVGGQDYVVKPYNASELLARVKTHIKIAVQAKRLKESYDELDKFCHTVSHDLKSPLQVIEQLAQMLSAECQDGISEDAQEIIKRICKKSQDTIRMTERLLEFSRMTERSCSDRLIDMNSLFREVSDELLSIEPGREIILELSDLPKIHGDDILFRLLAQNILGNAFKFSKNKNPAVIKVYAETMPDFYRITVEDNGVGFDMKYSRKLFNIFERLHSDTEFEGSGVGLAIAKKIMQRCGGQISIEAYPEKGARVILDFCRKQAEK